MTYVRLEKENTVTSFKALQLNSMDTGGGGNRKTKNAFIP
jgi:hypothetical protein